MKLLTKHPRCSTFCTALAAACIMLPALLIAGDDVPEPHLVFKKTVVVRDIAQGQAHAEEHVVKKGEHLWKILREQFNMSDTSINFFCKIAKAVNPDIEDLNVLQPSQNILLPFKYVPSDGTDNSTIMIETQDYHHVVKPKEHLGHILQTRTA